MNRDAPKGVPPYATPAKQRDSRSLRAQLTRAVGDALRAVRNSKAGVSSKQRLSDVLWNDRTLLASARATETGQSDTDELTNPRGSLRGVSVGRVASEPVEVVSDGEVAEWFDAALEETAGSMLDAQATDDVAAAIESVAADVGRRREPARRVLPQPAPVAESVTWEPLRTRRATPPQLAAAPAAESVAPDVGRVRKVTPPRIPAVPAPQQAKAAIPSGSRARSATPPQVVAKAVSEPVVPRAAPAAELSPPPPAAGAAVVPPPVAVVPPPVAVAPPAPARVASEDDDEAGEEPIQTRSMARLLALQGHRRRALAIYDALLKADASDATLRAEADALRQ